MGFVFATTASLKVNASISANNSIAWVEENFSTSLSKLTLSTTDSYGYLKVSSNVHSYSLSFTATNLTGANTNYTYNIAITAASGTGVTGGDLDSSVSSGYSSEKSTTDPLTSHTFATITQTSANVTGYKFAFKITDADWATALKDDYTGTVAVTFTAS